MAKCRKGVIFQKKTTEGCLRRFVKRGAMVKELAKWSLKRKRKQFDKQSKENKVVVSLHLLSTGSTELSNFSYLAIQS